MPTLYTMNKYHYNYCDHEGKPCQVALDFVDYLGESTEVQGAPPPFSKTYESGSDFKFDPIRPCKGTANFVTSDKFPFNDLWDIDERNVKLRKYTDGQLDYAGWVIPNGFQYPFKNGLKYVEVNATDGLSTLESIPFLDAQGNTYGTQDLVYNDGLWFPFSLIATEILRKLELDLNTWISVDVYERSMMRLGDRDADPLSNSFVNVKTYINENTNDKLPWWKDAGETWDCLQVMRNLLLIWGAKLYQEGGVWRIKTI